MDRWRVVTARRLRELPADLLESLVRPSAYTCRTELSSLEGPRNNTRHLLVVDGNDAPVAYVPVFSVDPAHTRGYDPRVPFGLAGPGRFGLIGAMGGHYNHLMFRAGLPVSDRAAAAGVLVDHALSVLDDECVVLPYLDAVQAAAVPGGRRHRESRGVLDLGWATFEEYRDSLSRKPRATVRNERRAFEPVSGELVEVPLAPLCDELAPLLNQVERKYGHDFPVEHVSWYLRTIARTMGEHGQALVLSQDGVPVAFSVVWQHPDEWHVRAWGCDYGVVGKHAEYANLVFYEPISRAIQRGVPVVHFGPASLSAKTIRGARLEELVSVLVR